MSFPATLSRLVPTADTTPSVDYQRQLAETDRERVKELEQRVEQLQQENTGLALRANQHLDQHPHVEALTKLAEEVDAWLCGTGSSMVC